MLLGVHVVGKCEVALVTGCAGVALWVGGLEWDGWGCLKSGGRRER